MKTLDPLKTTDAMTLVRMLPPDRPKDRAHKAYKARKKKSR